MGYKSSGNNKSSKSIINSNPLLTSGDREKLLRYIKEEKREKFNCYKTSNKNNNIMEDSYIYNNHFKLLKFDENISYEKLVDKVSNVSSDTYIFLPYKFIRTNYNFVNDIKEMFNLLKGTDNIFIIDDYEHILDYLFFYYIGRNYGIKIGIKVKNNDDIFFIIDINYKINETYLYEALVLDLTNMYEDRSFEYFNKVILKDIRMYRDISYRIRKHLLINMDNYSENKYFERLYKSGFKNLYIETK